MVIYQNNMPQVERKDVQEDGSIKVQLEKRAEYELKYKTIPPTTTTAETVNAKTINTIIPQQNSISEAKVTRTPTSRVLSYPDSRAIVIIGCNRMEQMKLSVLNVFALYGVKKYSVYLSLGCPDKVNKDVGLHSFINALIV